MARLTLKYRALDWMRVVVRADVFICACLYIAANPVAGAPLADKRPTSSKQAAANKRVEYRAYALQNQGDARRGQSVFENETKACVKCHSIDGKPTKAGPDLRIAGDKFDRRALIDAVLEPSSRIAIGYDSTVVEDDNGKIHVGVLQRVTDQWIELLDHNSERIRIPAGEIVEQQTAQVSMMPDGLENTMSQQEFADLIAYLETLKEAPQGSSAPTAARDEIPPSAVSVSLVPFFDEHVRLSHPVWYGQVPGSDNRFVVLEHFGKSWLIEKHPDGDRVTPFLDLSGLVRPGGATGLLGMAFHPRFRDNRQYFLKYQISENGRISTIVEQRWSADDGRSDSGRAPRRLLKIPGSTQDHNGGCLEFGPDGYLYIGMGDSGPQGDPQGHGQDRTTLLGKILRIDVDHSDQEQQYAIPPDNPFLRTPGVKSEIWAYGFREPWRFSFDSQTGDLWVGDVGQDRFEEIAVVRAGENHGWNVYEGFAPYSDRFQSAGAAYAQPIVSYSRRLGFSVTGGYVYRGRQAPPLNGCYIFGDFESRRIWALRRQHNTLSDIVEIGRSPSRIASFAQHVNGELYLVGYDSGVIYHLDLQDVDPTPLKARPIAETSESAPVPWRFTLTAPAGDWTVSGFNDKSWAIGPGGFGSTGTPGAVVRTEWRTNNIWLRREFNLPPNGNQKQKVALRLHHDEDTEIYLNGIEIGRLTHWTTGYGEVPLSTASIRALRSGRNVLAIHCRQQNGGQYIDAGLVEYSK